MILNIGVFKGNAYVGAPAPMMIFRCLLDDVGVMFIVLNFLDPPELRVGKSRLFLGVVFIAGFATSGIVLLVWWASGATNVMAMGASGIVYAAFGVVFASALMGLPEKMSKFSRDLARLVFRKPRYRGVEWGTYKEFLIDILAPGVFFGVLLWMLLAPNELFGATGGGISGHAMGFLLGFTGVFLSERRPSKQRSRTKNQ